MAARLLSTGAGPVRAAAAGGEVPAGGAQCTAPAAQLSQLQRVSGWR